MSTTLPCALAGQKPLKGAADAGADGRLHHLARRVRVRRGLARLVGPGGARVPRLAGRAAGGGLHGPDGREHLPAHVAASPPTASRAPTPLAAHVEGRVLVDLDGAAGVGNTHLVDAGRRRGGARDEGRGHRVHAHDRQPHAVPLAARGRPRRPVPRGRLPRDHREHRARADLRRLPRCRPRHGRAAAPSTAGSSCSSTSRRS